MPPLPHLDEIPDRVTDRESFLDFVRALAADKKDEVVKERVWPSSPWGPGANGWEHGTIEAYLDAAVRCIEDNARTGRGEVLPATPMWRAFAAFLYAGKFYE